MQTFRTLEAVTQHPYAVAIGMFDGVHLGHRVVLNQALDFARARGLKSLVLTFENHPQTVVSKTPLPLLSTTEERLQAFAEMGFDAALVLDFTPQLRELTADRFVQDVLVEGLHAQMVSVGYDHRFGADRRGDGEFLKASGQRHGFEVAIVEPIRVDEQIISSTMIRKLLAYGDIEQAGRLLGHPYRVCGQVERGVGRGRTIGFPTANITLPPLRLLPKQGVYAGWADLNNGEPPMAAVCNIGVSPTFGDQTQARLEVHVLDYEGDLYDTPLCFTFTARLRNEMAFASPQALIEQIHADCQCARLVLAPVQATSQSSQR